MAKVRFVWVRGPKPPPDFLHRKFLSAFGPSGTEYRFGRAAADLSRFSVIPVLPGWHNPIAYGSFAYCVACARLFESSLPETT